MERSEFTANMAMQPRRREWPVTSVQDTYRVGFRPTRPQSRWARIAAGIVAYGVPLCALGLVLLALAGCGGGDPEDQEERRIPTEAVMQ